jgi:hypothetical protein
MAVRPVVLLSAAPSDRDRLVEGGLGDAVTIAPPWEHGVHLDSGAQQARPAGATKVRRRLTRYVARS